MCVLETRQLNLALTLADIALGTFARWECLLLFLIFDLLYLS